MPSACSELKKNKTTTHKCQGLELMGMAGEQRKAMFSYSRDPGHPGPDLAVSGATQHSGKGLSIQNTELPAALTHCWTLDASQMAHFNDRVSKYENSKLHLIHYFWPKHEVWHLLVFCFPVPFVNLNQDHTRSPYVNFKTLRTSPLETTET